MYIYPAFAEDHVHAPRMNAKKKLLGGMSLNGQAIPVGGITPKEYAEIIAREFRHGLGVGVNKGTTGMPVGLFSIKKHKDILCLYKEGRAGWIKLHLQVSE